MVSTFTPNIHLEEPARGDYVGTWDTPVNANMTLLDLIAGSVTIINLNNSPVVLSAPQYQSKTIIFGSTLTGNVTVTFPASFVKSYEILMDCTGSSAFVVTLTTTAPGSGTVGCAPGNTFSVLNAGAFGGMILTNLPPVGAYMDFAGSSVPAWVNACTFPPYLNCDGSVFSAATYPFLATLLGGTTLPDRRGTAGYTLNQGTGRLTAASGGLDGDTRFATKTTDSLTLATSNLPAYTPTGTVTVATSGVLPMQGFAQTGFVVPGKISQGSNNGGSFDQALVLTSTAAFTGAAQGGVSNPLPAIGTGTVYGITMIRAA